MLRETGGGYFPGFFLAGFECASHRRRDGTRVDSLEGTAHAHHALADYRQADRHGLYTMRDGLRWHRIAARAGLFDWSSWLPQLRAARAAGVRVIWDLWHYGTPDRIDILGSGFVAEFEAFAEAAARIHAAETDAVPLWCPANEISFFAFIAGEVSDFHPHARGRGQELKVRLAQAAIAAAHAVRRVDPRARLLWAEPAIVVHPASAAPADRASAAGLHRAQFDAWDMVCGRMEPGLGGDPALLDLVGVNYYPANQWVHGRGTVPLGTHGYRPFASVLADIHARYGRPLLVAETGAEGSARAAWLHYVCGEAARAIRAGVPVEGLCLYPVTDYPGWDDQRPCETGLFGPADADGRRPVHADLDAELQRQRALLAVLAPTSASRPSASSAASAAARAPAWAFPRPSASGRE